MARIFDSAVGLLVVIVLLLFAVSYILLLASGVDPFLALIWNILASFDVNFAILPVKIVSTPLILAASLIDAFIFAILAVVLATVFFNLLKHANIRKRFVMGRIKKIEQHVIIVPYNSFAHSITKELDEVGQKWVMIAEDEAAAHRMYRHNQLAVVGDPKLVEVYNIAGIGKAKYVIACSDDDLQNAMIAITAKSASARARVISRVSAFESMPKISKTGAMRMIMPEVTAGEEIGRAIAENLLKKVAEKA